jgi:spore coat protein U-like protein
MHGNGGSAGTATVSGSGSGSNQTCTVYARMPARSPVPRPGTYTDSITLTTAY